jgi:hypothetical protein
LCGSSVCSGIAAECESKAPTCCDEYWAPLARGETPQPHAEICKTISKQSDCCQKQVEVNDWDKIYCGTDGQFISGHNKIDNTWYCGMDGDKWDDVCAYAKGCATTYKPLGAQTSCNSWGGTSGKAKLDSPWDGTYPVPPPPTPPKADDGKSEPKTEPSPKPKIRAEYIPPIRLPSKRAGSIWGNWGGRE